MSVTQVHEALGSFEFELLGNVPREVLDGIEHFDHIAIIPGRIDPRQYGDGCLDAARYVGVVRRKKIADDGRTNLIQDDIRISGVGMEFWLGDDEGKGDIFESPVEFTEESFYTVMETLRPAAVAAGVITPPGLTGETATASGNASTPDYLVCSDADATDITIGDTIQLFDSGGDLKEGTIFTVTQKNSAFGFTNIVFTPNAATNTQTNDVLKVGAFGTYSGRHQWETPRVAIKYVCETMSTTSTPVGYRVTNSAALDAGPEDALFVTDPICIIMRKGSTQGEDLFMRSLPSTVDMDIDMEDFATRVVMLAEADGENLATGTADIADIAPGVNVFKDLHGNALALTRLVSESDTTEENADTRAEIALRSVIDPHRTLTISTDDFDIHGSFEVGDYIYVYDPDSGLFDLDNETYIRGVRINPIKLRVTEMDFPITEGYTVAHRNADGDWTDLTDYIHFEETQPSQVVIGDFNRDLTGLSNPGSDRTGAVIPPNNSVPAAPAWVTASFQTTNYVDTAGNPKARQKLVWSVPLNTDGTAITDGDRYEIQYKLDEGSLYSQTWAAASTLTWDQLNVWDQPVEPDDTPYQTLIVGWGETTVVIHELPVGTGFDSRIRAIDRGGNASEWSATSTWITSEDNIPPSAPAAPVVAGSKIAIQVVHELGMSSGGTFNLENDLAYLEVHYSSDENFFPSETSLAGRLRADKGMMNAQTAAIGTFTIPETNEVYVKVVAVDTGGNRSSASESAAVTAELIDSAYISELTASKISAGTIGANLLISGSIKTAEEGQRVELSSAGLQAFDAEGDLTSNISSDPAAGGEFLSLRDSTGTTVVSIADNGDAAFNNVYANTDVFIAGASLLEMIEALPKGILALTTSTSDTGATTASGSAGAVAFNRIIVSNLDPTRQYKIGYIQHIDVQIATPTYVGITCYYAWDRKATVADNDGILFVQQWGGRSDSATDMAISGVHTFQDLNPEGTDFHLGFYLTASESGVRCESESYNRVWLEDIGLALTYDNFTPETSGGGSGGSTPVQTYTKTYTSTWTRSYQGDGDLRISNGDIYQGQYSSTNGNQRSLIGFDDDQIRADLSGATVTKVEIRLDNTHFYNNSGGTAVLGLHDYGSAPGSWSDSRVVQSIENETWAKGALKWVTVSNFFGTELQNGDATGLALGPGDSTSLTYYGYFVGQNGTNKPQIRITYTK